LHDYKISQMHFSILFITMDKYMAIWENRNGKYVTIRDIYSGDAKPKR